MTRTIKGLNAEVAETDDPERTGEKRRKADSHALPVRRVYFIHLMQLQLRLMLYPCGFWEERERAVLISS